MKLEMRIPKERYCYLDMPFDFPVNLCFFRFVGFSLNGDEVYEGASIEFIKSSGKIHLDFDITVSTESYYTPTVAGLRRIYGKLC